MNETLGYNCPYFKKKLKYKQQVNNMLSNIMLAKNMVYGNLIFKEVGGKTYVKGDSGESILLENGEQYLFIKNIPNNRPVVYQTDFNRRI